MTELLTKAFEENLTEEEEALLERLEAEYLLRQQYSYITEVGYGQA